MQVASIEQSLTRTLNTMLQKILAPAGYMQAFGTTSEQVQRNNVHSYPNPKGADSLGEQVPVQKFLAS